MHHRSKTESAVEIVTIVTCISVIVFLLFIPYIYTTSRSIEIENFLDEGCEISGEERTRWDYIRKIPVSEIFIECPDRSFWY